MSAGLFETQQEAAPAVRRDPGQTGHRPARPIMPLRDPAALARVLGGLRSLPTTPPAQRASGTGHG
ncbi:MAG TPA: hypothetical protein VGS19_38395 [Streptosporangiaceae bacterium]|nr:hypothetical protein [Streptosporangiaceae bacterium]